MADLYITLILFIQLHSENVSEDLDHKLMTMITTK